MSSRTFGAWTGPGCLLENLSAAANKYKYCALNAFFFFFFFCGLEDLVEWVLS